MALSVIRFDTRQPDRSPSEISSAFGTILDMSSWAESKGFGALVLSEHHGTDDSYLPSPLVLAAACAARTRKIPITIAALLVPLHDPLRLAEDIAVVDQISGGRLSIVAGLGYREVEYEMFGREWKGRGRRLDECLDAMLAAWTGEPFTYEGRTVQVTPRPVQQPHPNLFVGGSGPAAARRAARLGLGFYPSVADDELIRLYRDECERLGTRAGHTITPTGPGTLFCSEDPDRTWAEIGPHLLHDAMAYNSWQPKGQRSHVKSVSTDLEALRAEGIYQILTPDECVALAGEMGRGGAFTHHPLCGGTPADIGWASLELYADKVLPALLSSRG
jgi:alkanesulfonate monooxygenase SsuD/methylene tetrahydromethanopterin reductase-like flavin-dependent oxidoreductase (luciferase family)